MRKIRKNMLQNCEQFSDFIKELIIELKNAVNQFNYYATILLVCHFNKSVSNAVDTSIRKERFLTSFSSSSKNSLC